MDTDQLNFRSGKLVAPRRFSKPVHFVGGKISLNNPYFKDGKIYLCLDNGTLSVVDEASFNTLKEASFKGISPDYVTAQGVLFSLKGSDVLICDSETLEITTKKFKARDTLIPLYHPTDDRILFSYRKITKCYGLFEWPSMRVVWEHETPSELIVRGQVVCGEYLYVFHKRGLRKINLATGDLVWDKASNDWASHPIFKNKLSEPLTIRSEHTGIYANTLVLAMNPEVILGIDIHTGDVRWALDVLGNQLTKITEEGIAYFVRTEGIYRIDVAKGELLPLLAIQYSPVLEKVENARLGGWDISTTHIIAEVSARTAKGAAEGHIVGINLQTGQVNWAVPIRGTVTRLMLLNNRIYVTGMLATADKPKAGFSDLIIEGEGGYIPD